MAAAASSPTWAVLLAAVLAGGAASGLFAYIAARKRDIPAAADAHEALTVTKERAAVDGAAAASEAWAEYAQMVSGRLQRVEDALASARAELETCRMNAITARAKLTDMAREVDVLRNRVIDLELA